MKTLQQHITEKLIINRNSKEHNYHPETKDELKELIGKLIKERGNEADLNDIDVSEITDMSELFTSISHNKFNGDISEWDVSNVKNMEEMFARSKFNGDISNWDVSSVENMEGMFYMSKFNNDISNWNINKICSTVDIFRDCPIEEEYKPNFNK